MLPKTDQIALMQSPTAEPVLADWDRVSEVAGDLLERLDMWPERWRVSDFPEEGQIAKIGDG